VPAPRLGTVALQHRHTVPLLDRAQAEDLAHADHALAAEPGDQDLGAGLHRRRTARHWRVAFAARSACTRTFMSRMIFENSGRLFDASCLMPVSHVKSLSVPSALRPCVCS